MEVGFVSADGPIEREHVVSVDMERSGRVNQAHVTYDDGSTEILSSPGLELDAVFE